MRIDRYVHDERLTWGAAAVLLVVTALHAAGIGRLLLARLEPPQDEVPPPVFQVSLLGEVLDAIARYYETQNANVLEGLKAMMSWIPAGAGVLAILVVLFYRLDEPLMKKISAELQARRAAAPAESPGA